MATTITSTKLDFQEIKETLKNSLKNTDEFNDYDFEGSGISNILDVLAYNTHLNALIANFALNESYLVTAQLRPSVVSLAESLGYVPGSKKSPEATINLTINTVDVVGIANTQIINPGELILRGTKDGLDYTFSNRESISATSREGEAYKFAPLDDPSQPIRVFEGEEVDIQFIVGDVEDAVYVIPDIDMDISTAIVKVFENQEAASTGGSSTEHTNLLDATTITELSRLYVLRESPNGFYELTFGNGNSLGQAPVAGNVVNVNYLRTNGQLANNIPTLTLNTTINFAPEVAGNSDVEISEEDVTIAVRTRSAGGGGKESLESMRLNAPYQYAAQNRMVTATDYSALILKKYSAFINDIKSWGGEDDPLPDYGSVFTSIVFKDNLTNATIDNVRRGILDLADDFSIASFDLKFTDPEVTYISAQTFFQWNPSLTGLTESTIRANVQSAIDQYFLENTGKFDQVFRRSNLLTRIDSTNPSVLSSRSNIKINRRITPTFNLNQNHVLTFPVSLRESTLVIEPTITSSLFIYRNQTCFIRNKLDKRTRISLPGRNPVVFDSKPSSDLELVSITGKVLVSNIGSYDASKGIVNISGLRVQSIPNARNYIKIFAVPANESAVVAKLNNVIRFDPEESFAKAILVDTE
jgi:hypothetical protein